MYVLVLQNTQRIRADSGRPDCVMIIRSTESG